MVSVGRPVIKYSFKLGMPFSTSVVAAVKMSFSLSPLLIVRRRRSVPASGAMVAVLTLLCFKAASSPGVSRSARRELNEILMLLILLKLSVYPLIVRDAGIGNQFAQIRIKCLFTHYNWLYFKIFYCLQSLKLFQLRFVCQLIKVDYN